MSKLLNTSRWLIPALLLISQSGCVNRAQVIDFGRTEVSRVTADIVGRLVTLFQTAT